MLLKDDPREDITEGFTLGLGLAEGDALGPTIGAMERLADGPGVALTSVVPRGHSSGAAQSTADRQLVHAAFASFEKLEFLSARAF